ncbi:MAG: glycosyltransferase [Bryobacteraceae bacterium]
MSGIAVVHDYFTQQGGAERVAEQLARMFPSSDVYTTVALDKKLPPGISATKLRTSWMQRLPGLEGMYRLYFPLYPLGVDSLDLSKYELVLSSSSGYAKGVRTGTSSLHVCYCHTPMRWVWRYQDYAQRERFGVPKRLILPLLLDGLKNWDLNASRQPDQYVANSRIVAERIYECYKRDAVVIPPPIDVHRFNISSRQDDYYLVLSRLVPYKRIDLAIQACNLLQRRLFIIGDGTDRKRLESLASKTVRFLGRLSDQETATYAQECRALIFPGEEDFGMVPLELAAAGRPSIAFRAGGATETVIAGTTGVFFDEPTAQSLVNAITEFECMRWIPSKIRAHATLFDVTTFHERFKALLRSLGVSAELLNMAAQSAEIPSPSSDLRHDEPQLVAYQ